MKLSFIHSSLVVAGLLIITGCAGMAANSPVSLYEDFYNNSTEMMDHSEAVRMGVNMQAIGYADLYLAFSQDLMLTETQISQLQEIQRMHHENIGIHNEKLLKLERELRVMMNQVNPDINAITDKINAVQAARTEKVLSQIEYAAESRDILNNYQLSIAADIGNEFPTETPIPPLWQDYLAPGAMY